MSPGGSIFLFLPLFCPIKSWHCPESGLFTAFFGIKISG
uniref:Uncharacterized protein n=1 Tax=Siphoviridae sp. ctPsO101 TaxID=2825487 RepID=A0A8S5PXF3_9CAUD|nr:MAG TPA: hypothetical protein [Siphoviridae sp. ctPsO101]